MIINNKTYYTIMHWCCLTTGEFGSQNYDHF